MCDAILSGIFRSKIDAWLYLFAQLLADMADNAPAQPEAEAAPKSKRARKKMVLRDVAQVKQQKEHLQKQLKESIASETAAE